MYKNLLTASNIRRLKLEKGYTSTYLARRLDVQTGYLAKLEKGEKGVSPAMEEKLCEVFDCNVEDLYRPLEDGIPEMLKPVIEMAVDVFGKANLEEQHELCAKLLKGLREG